MNINRPTPSIASPAPERSMTNVRPNAQTSNSPVSENTAASPVRSHQYGCMSFLLHADLAQAFLLKRAKKLFDNKFPKDFFHQFDASNLTQKSRIELAHHVAEKYPRDIAEHIQNFGISDEHIKIELARHIAEKYAYILPEHIQNFGISDVHVKIELARHIAEKYPFDVAEHIQNFGISDEHVKIELARHIAEKYPRDVAEHIQNFGISDERVRTELARHIAEKHSSALPEHIQNFGISDERVKIELARRVAEKYPYILPKHIQNFGISGEHVKIELARRVAEKDPYALPKHVQNFGISDERVKIELARRVAEKDPYALPKHIQNFGISDERVRIELAHLIAEKFPSDLIEHIPKFEISDERVRTELARRAAKEYWYDLVKIIQNFGISDELIKIELAHIVAEENSSFLLSKLDKLEITNQPVLASLYATAYLNAIGCGWIKTADEKLKEKFLRSDPDSMSLEQAAAQLGNHHPVIDDLLKAAGDEPDPHIRETLSTWAKLVSLRFAANPMPEAAWQILKEPLKAIWKWRVPAMRYTLADMLTRQCLPPIAKNADAFLDFCKKFTKPHTHLYSILLFPLFESATDSDSLDTLKSLAARLHRPEFKDVKRQKNIVNLLLTLTKADRLPVELKRRLLQAALPSNSDKEAARSLIETASIMECMASLAQEDNTLGKAVLQRLESIQRPDDFNKQMAELFHELFQLQHLPDTQKVRKQFSDYWDRSRKPVCLLSYAAKMNNSLKGYEKEGVLAALRQFVNAVVLSTEPERTFRQLRYDPAASSHLRMLADKAPAAFEKWQQPCVHAPSAAFLADASGSAAQTDITVYLRRRIVEDRHVPEGTYHLLEQVLNGQMPLASALRQAKQQEEAGLLRLLEEGTSVKKKADLIAQLLESVPPGQFHRDLTDLKNQLTASPRQDNKQFTIIDTDEAEDLFLCGTEVTGSCQSIDGRPDLNKALMGYVLDGKYRMLAIKSENGRLMGRRVLRLLWDEQAQQPMLHLEHLYANPGIPKKYEHALVELALQKAQQMNCALVSHDGTLKSSGDYPASLTAYPTPCPFEYVDAQQLRVMGGQSGYKLSDARIVASPH